MLSAVRPRNTWVAFALALGCCALSNTAAQSPPVSKAPVLSDQQRSGLLAEADRLRAEAQRLDKAGKLADAIAMGEKAIATLRSVHGNVHVDVVRALAWLAERYEQQERFDAAQK